MHKEFFFVPKVTLKLTVNTILTKRQSQNNTVFKFTEIVSRTPPIQANVFNKQQFNVMFLYALK